MGSLLNGGLVVAYLVLLVLLGVQYRRENLDRRRMLLLGSMCLTWLAYGLLQLSQDGLVRTGTPANYLLDGLSFVVLVTGVYGLFRWWRDERDDGTSTG